MRRQLGMGARRCTPAIVAALICAGLAFAQSTDSLIARAMADGRWSAHADSAGAGGIEPGPLFRIGRVEVRDRQGRFLPEFSGRKFEGLAAGRDNLAALQGEARAAFLNHGFPFAEIRMIARADSSRAGTVDVRVEVDRGSRFKLGEARVFGTRTSPETVRRLALWKEAEDYSEDRIDRGAARLRRTGYFESVAWTGLYRDSVRNVLYPVLELPDVHGNTLDGLVGYDSKAAPGQELTGFLGVHLINLFGTARDFDFSFDSRPGQEREIRAAYTEPWLFNLPIGARAEIDFLQQDTVFWEWNENLVFFRDLGFSSRLEVSFGNQSNSDAVAGLRTRAFKSGLQVLIDTRDRATLTGSGVLASAGLTGLHRTLSGTLPGAADSAYFLAQFQTGVQLWHPLAPRLGFKLALQAATNYPLNHINQGELYYVGGARSLRGYREREFPTNAYVLGEGELHFSVGRRGRLLAFADPGVVNRLTGRYDWRGVFGYGAGVELSQGDWSLELSYAISPERGLGDGLVHVALENRF